MRNCVGTYREMVEEGETAILHADVRGEPLTMGLDRMGTQWMVSELKGFANRPATTEEWLALLPFFEGNGIMLARER